MNVSAPIGPTDHGGGTTSWSPTDGGTLTATSREPSAAFVIGGSVAGIGGAFATASIMGKASKQAIAVARVGGLEGADLARLAAKAHAPGVLAVSGIAAAALIGAHAIGMRVAPDKTTRSQMSRAEYLEQDLDDPARTLGSALMLSSMAGGVVASGLLSTATNLALAGAAPKARTGGTFGAMAAGWALGIMAVGRADVALRD